MMIILRSTPLSSSLKSLPSRQIIQRRHRQLSTSQSHRQSVHDRNTRMAMYATSAVIGAVGATYASVPLYKLFCQSTGFGGTTQRVDMGDTTPLENYSPFAIDEAEEEDKSLSGILRRRLLRQLDSLYLTVQSWTRKTITGNRVGNTHGNTWTDEDAAAKLSNLKPVPNGRLLRIFLDANTSDVLPWTFTPTQSSVRVVPGETALCFFTCTNNSDKPITGVATYNVHPPKAGLYFNKVQCFCFEEQRLLPGETVDMPVFFYIDPEFVEDPYMDRVGSITLSYTFFKTDVEYDDDDDDEEEAA